jgi:predicted Zn-dependent peptidase
VNFNFRSGLWNFVFLAMPIVTIGLFVFKSDKTRLLVESELLQSVIVIPNPSKPEIQVHVIIRLSPAAKSAPEGLPHYVEHLAWLNSIGAKMRLADRHTNAWTTNQAIGYWLSGPKDGLDNMLQSISGVFKPITLPGKFAEEERGIIQREYDLRLGNNLDGRVQEALGRFIYAGNDLAKSVIGTPTQIAAFGYEQAKAFHAQTHTMRQASLVIIGDVSESQLKAALSKLPQAPEEQVNSLAPSLLTLAKSASETLRFPDASAAPRLIWRRIVKLEKAEQFELLQARLALMRDVLDTNLPGGLAGPLRFDKAITSSFDIAVWPLDEHHAEISFVAAPDAGVSLATVKAAFESIFQAIAQAGIPKETYDRVRPRFMNYWPDWDDEDEVAEWMSNYVLATVPSGRPLMDSDALKSIDSQITIDSLNSLLKQFAVEGRTTAAFIGPEGSFE